MILVAALATMHKTEKMHRNHVRIKTRGGRLSLVMSVGAIEKKMVNVRR